MNERRIVFNRNICDGSSHCWFLKTGNCPGEVFKYNSAEQIKNRIIVDIDACVGCEQCDGHCPAARLSTEEERDICTSALKEIETEIGVRLNDGLFAEPIINPELNIYVKDNNIKVGVQKTLEQLRKFPDRLQIIELFAEPICAIATVPYNMFYKAIEDVLNNKIFHCGIDRRVIYTHEDSNAIKEFLNVLNISESKYLLIPLIIIYLNGKVLAVWGHGEINQCNFYQYQDSLTNEIIDLLRGSGL